MPKIIVIIVTYNGERWICKCLDCLAKSQKSVEIIAIDNASTDNTVNLIHDKSPKVSIIKQDINLGFGQANNIGIKKALERDADYLFLLNQDAYVYPDTIGNLLSIHEKHLNYGIISPVQLNGNGKKLDILFKKFISNNYSNEFVREVEMNCLGLPELFAVHFVNAASWFISRACIEKTGLFSPLFYHYGEDNNYCSRTQYHGFKVGIAPQAAIHHDKIYDLTKDKLLLRQIHLVPLYILLDLRKNIILACLLVFWKIIGYFRKGAMQRSSEICRQTIDEIKWISKNFSIIMHNRIESKKPYKRDVSFQNFH
jgi:GT2 family glycosyltransferase